MPVLKFFNPLGEGGWLATELDADGDTLFGLADLGCPELGSFSLEEMTSIRLPFGMGIERDILHRELPDLGLGQKPPARQGASPRPNKSSTRGSASV